MARGAEAERMAALMRRNVRFITDC